MNPTSATCFSSIRMLACAMFLGAAIPVLATPPAQFNANITNGATTVAVNFVHHPIRGAGFKVLKQDSAGVLNEVAAPEARTYIGTVAGYPGATACAVLLPDGTVWEYIVFEAGDQWWADNGTVTWTYGSKTFTPSWPTSAVVTPEQAAVVSHVVAGDVIADIPYSNFTYTHGSSVDHAVFVTEFCLMQTNLIYLRDLGFLHRTGRIVIRGSQTADPYQTGDPLTTLRGQFGPFVGHEALKFVTVPGCNYGASLVGTVGDWYSSASVNDSNARGDAFIIWRHEVGHNHGAGDGQGGYCENLTLLNANQVGRLSGPEEAAMIRSRQHDYYYNASVLENLGSYAAFNLPPRASLDLSYATPGAGVLIDVMANDHDSNGNAFSLLSFDSTSVKGGTLSRSVGTGPGGRDQILFTASGTIGSDMDSFQYRIVDSNGSQALGNVYVMAPPAACAYWPLDESAGTSAANQAGTNAATLYNGASWVAGTVNNALSFNGVNQYAKAYVNIPETNTAVSLWFRTSQAGGGLYSVTEDGGGHDRHIYLNGGNLKARLWNEETISTTGQNYADGEWHHVVHTFGGTAGGQKLYVDGTLVASGNKAQSDFNWQSAIHLGYCASSPTPFFNGQLDDVRVWNRALTATEALALAERSGTASFPNPATASIVASGQNPFLNWLSPTGATSHDVYLGEHEEVTNGAPWSPAYMGNFSTKPLETQNIAPGLHFWRVDERRNGTIFKGPVWNFQYIGNTGTSPITLTEPTSWWLNANDSFLQSGILSGTGSLLKDGPGTLVLTGNNTHTGGTLIKDGVLQIGNGGTTGSLGTGPVTVNSTLAFNRSDNITFSGTLNGPGNVIQYGPGNLTLSGGAITYTGTTTLAAGSLTLAATPNFNSPIQLNAGLFTCDSTGNYVMLQKPVTGIGPIQISGNNAYWTYMSAENTYSGGTLINPGGMMLLGNNTPTGSVLGDITNNGTLGIYHSNAWTFSNNVTGTGALNLYSPGGNPVTVSGNTISLATLTGCQNPGGILANTTVNLSGALNLSTNSTLTIADGANITATGGMTQYGNAYVGGTSTLKITGGNLTFGSQINDGWDGAYTVLQTGGTVRTPGITGGNGGGTWPTDTYTLNGGALILGASGINGPCYKWPWFPYGGGLTMNLNFGGGTLSASANWSTSFGATTTGTTTVAPAGYTITLGGPLTGTGGINLTGTGTLLLTGNNTYSGTTTIGSGTILQLGNNTSTGSLAGNIVNQGSLNLYHNNAWTFSNNLSGTGTLNLYSPGGNLLTLGGGSTITQSTLNANQNPGGILSDTTVNLSGSINLATNSTLTIADGANITATGGMTQVGNAYVGGTSTLKITGGAITFGNQINDGWDGRYTILQTGGTLTTPGITGGNGGGCWGTNTYTLTGGTLILGASGINGPCYKWPWFPNGGGLTMALNLGGGTLSASADSSSGWGATLTGTNGNLTVAPVGHSITFTAPFTGTGGIALTGTGTLILAANNTYSGPTTIATGTTFGGAGGMTGPVTNHGTLSPGNNGPGNLAVNNTLTLAPGAAIAWQVTDWFGAPGTGYDSLTVNALDLTVTPEAPVTIQISAQTLTHFTEAEKSFTLIQSTTPITTWDPAKFILDSSAFTAGQGTWSIRKTANAIELVYTNNLDTDNDGTPDWKESGYYHTNPNAANTITTTDYVTLPPHNYATATGHWNRDASGSLTAIERRGEITYNFTVAANDSGFFEIALTGGAAGVFRPAEYLPLAFSINGTRIATASLPSLNGAASTATVITPWLTPGTYALTVLHDNFRGDLALRIDSLLINKLTGLDSRLATDNHLTRIPTTSLTSPVTIEGTTTYLPGLQGSVGVSPASSPVSFLAGPDSTFYANIPLAETAATTLTASFQSGSITETHTIDWTPTNLCEHSALHIRQGDSLRLDASNATHTTGTYTVKLDGVLIADSQNATTHPIGQPFAATFDTPGSYTLTVTFPDNTTHATALTVHSAGFGAALSARANYPRPWTPTSLAADLLIQPDSRLTWQETTSGSAPRSFSVTPHDVGPRHILARLPDTVAGAPGAILARGTVNAYYLASIDETADPKLITIYPDGTALMSGTFIAVGLPSDIRILLTTLYQGTVFANGSNQMWLSSADFDQNGIATVYYERAGSGGGYMCTYVNLYTTQP